MIKIKKTNLKEIQNGNFLKIYEKGKENFNLLSKKKNIFGEKKNFINFEENLSFFEKEDILDFNFISIKTKEKPFYVIKKKFLNLKKVKNINIENETRKNACFFYLHKLKKKNKFFKKKKKFFLKSKKKISEKNSFKIRKNFSFSQKNYFKKKKKNFISDKNIKNIFSYKSLDYDFRKSLKLVKRKKSFFFVNKNLKNRKKIKNEIFGKKKNFLVFEENLEIEKNENFDKKKFLDLRKKSLKLGIKKILSKNYKKINLEIKKNIIIEEKKKNDVKKNFVKMKEIFKINKKENLNFFSKLKKKI